MHTKPILQGRYWRMPDGELVPNIYGGSDDGENDKKAVKKDAKKAAENLGGADEDTMLRKELKATRSEAASYRRKLRELEDKIEGVDVDKYNSLIEKEQEIEQKRLADEGEYDKLLEEHRRKSEAQLQKSQEHSGLWKGRFEKQVIDNVLLTAATERSVSASEAVTLIRANYTFGVNEEGLVEITDAKGQALFDDSGNAVTPQGVMSQFLEARPHLCKPTGGGSGSRGAGAPGRKPEGNKDQPLHGAQRIAAALRERASR